mgnify:CR=1 FL=1
MKVAAPESFELLSAAVPVDDRKGLVEIRSVMDRDVAHLFVPGVVTATALHCSRYALLIRVVCAKDPFVHFAKNYRLRGPLAELCDHNAKATALPC